MLKIEEILKEARLKKQNEMILNNWYHLRHVAVQDLKLLHQIIEKDPYAIMFVKNQTEELCLLAVTIDANTYGFIKTNWDSVDKVVKKELGLLPCKITTLKEPI